MQKSLKIQAQYVQEGMVLARDVDTDDALLVSQGSVLTGKLIRQLIKNDIEEVWIYDEVKTDNLKTYQSSIESFEELVKMVQNDEPISPSHAEDIIDNFSTVRSQRSLLKYINGIRKVDTYTYQHSLNVCYLSMMLGKWSKYPDLNTLALAGLFHDLGKVKISTEILNKPGSLTDEEWKEMRLHPYLGYEILRNGSDISQDILAGVLFHHERMNGKGYPQGLKGEEIPVIVRIISICDVFDALTSDRVYHDKRDLYEVLQFMHDCYYDFDIKYLRIFTENMLDVMVGEEVLLSNNQVGKIVFNNPYRSFAPLIQTEDGFVDLSTTNDIKIARVL